MRLSTQLLCIVWIASTSSLCSCISVTQEDKSTDVSLSGTSIHYPTFIEPAETDEDKASEEEIEGGVGDDDGEEGDDELEDGDGAEDDVNTDEPPTEPSIDFDDSDDLDLLAKGILGSKDNKESVVPCFGTWWPSSGGYVYYYQDYGTGGGTVPGGGTTGDGADDYSDYAPGKRGKRTKRRRRMRRNRARRARTSKRTTKKKA